MPTMSTVCRRCLRYFFCFLIDLDEVEREEPGGAGVLDVTNVRKHAMVAPFAYSAKIAKIATSQ
jgi:hypothetical protein